MFKKPVPITAGKWYVAWDRVSGPSSDCGSSVYFQVLQRSNNGTNVNAGQIPQLLFKVVAPEPTVSK